MYKVMAMLGHQGTWLSEPYSLPKMYRERLATKTCFKTRSLTFQTSIADSETLLVDEKWAEIVPREEAAAIRSPGSMRPM